MPLNVVDLIEHDHRELEELFTTLQNEPERRPTLVSVMVTLLTAHSRAEEAEVYPAAAEADLTDDVEHSQREHLEADQLAADLTETDPESPEFPERLDKLIEAVTHHVQEEESTVLPGMRANISADRLDELGRAFLASRGRHLGDMPADITKAELMQQASNADVPGASRLSKAELKAELEAEAEE